MVKPSPSDKPSENKSRIFETISHKGSQRKSVRITEKDLIRSDWLQLILSTLSGGLFGLAGSVLLWLGLALASPIFTDFPYTLLAFEIGGTTILALIGAFRNRFVSWIASRGLVLAVEVQMLLSWAYLVAIILALYAIFSVERVFVPYNLPLSVAFAGLYFFLIAPHFVVSQIIRETNGAGLSIIQFLEDRRAGNPRYFWLRRGMRGVERQLRASGLSVSPGVLFHGVAFALFKERLPDDELQSLGEWLIEPTNFQVVNPIISSLIWQSKQAKDEGFGKAPGIWDQLVELSQKIYRATGAAGKIATAIAAIIGVVLAVLRLIKP